jgi:hypothetical protein
MNSIKIICLCLVTLILLSASKSTVELEAKSFFKDQVELKIPTDFTLMTQEMMEMKYPSEQRPTLVYTDETGGINVALNLTPSKASQELLPQYLESLIQTFKNVHPYANWKGNGISEINGRNVGFMALITPAVDTEIYNLIFFTDVDGKLLFCSFNCTKKSIKKWEVTAKEIMNSLKVTL